MASKAPPPPHHRLLHTLVPLTAFHPVRTASHSSLHSLVAFALSHLAHPSCDPLVLHTLPPTTDQLDPAVAALPKLVSLHQLVLRTSTTPLHSYTLVDSFERHNLAPPFSTTTTDDDDEREQMRQDLVALDWLSARAGSNRRPRRKHTPLMLIVVSPVPLALPSSFTHQPPPRPSRSAKRALKRPAPAPPAPAPPVPPAPAATAADGGADEGDEPAGEDEGAAAAAAGPDEARRKRRKRRRGKGGTAGAASEGGVKGESKGKSKGEGKGGGS
ncbi:hypothetical protein JCM3775_006515 [Rhodotorula graminis]